MLSESILGEPAPFHAEPPVDATPATTTVTDGSTPGHPPVVPDTTAPDVAMPEPDQPPTAGLARALKLVATLTPADAAGCRAVLAVGAEGCDPLLRSLDAADLRTALEALAALAAEAEARWRSQPRFPAARATPPRAPAPRPAPAERSPTPTAPAASPIDPGCQADDPTPAPAAPAGQLALFG